MRDLGCGLSHLLCWLPLLGRLAFFFSLRGQNRCYTVTIQTIHVDVLWRSIAGLGFSMGFAEGFRWVLVACRCCVFDAKTIPWHFCVHELMG